MLLRLSILVLLLLAALGMGWFSTGPLDGKSVVRWNESDCGSWAWQARVGGIVLPFVEQGSCIAFEPGMSLPWESCCGETCIEAERVSDKMPAPCSVIYQPSGVRYEDTHTSQWNAEHVGG